MNNLQAPILLSLSKEELVNLVIKNTTEVSTLKKELASITKERDILKDLHTQLNEKKSPCCNCNCIR